MLPSGAVRSILMERIPAPVREFVLSNAGYWISEFHLDGLRLDATQVIFDQSPEHILAAITRTVRHASSSRSTVVVAENEPQQSMLARPIDQGGYGMDALWNDDFHHAARVALTGRNEAYYSDYRGTPQEFISAVKRGYLFQGQYYTWQRKRRGASTEGMKPESFILFIQNHDQVANSGSGRRLHFLTSPGRLRAMTALLLLAPGTPMLFQGQEFSASSPFLYFADHKPELGEEIKKGRRMFLAQFPSLASPDMQERFDDPTDIRTFLRSKLDFSERERHGADLALHCDLMRLRREDPVFRTQGERGVDGAVLGADSFVLRYFGERGDDRLVIVNFGRDSRLSPAPEPLLAPPAGSLWEIVWSSENPAYGGNGTSHVDTDETLVIPGEAALVLKARSRGERIYA